MPQHSGRGSRLVTTGVSASAARGADALRELKERGLNAGPHLAIGDGALGFWSALEQVYPETCHQRCWFHKSGNVLSALPKSLQGKAKADLQAIWMAPRRKAANAAFDGVCAESGAWPDQAGRGS